jgi:endoglucanase
MKPEEREKAAKITDLWVDIGATSRDEASRVLHIGDPGVIDARTIDLPNNRIVSRSIDNRIGAFIVLEALRRYAEAPGEANVVAVATTQEEIGYHGGGALVAAARIDPVMAIAVDVTFASDHPGVEKKEHGEHRIGGGPVLARGAMVSPVVLGLMREVAVDHDIPYTIHAVGKDTATDADFIHLAREGVATGLVSIPNRYMHSPNELVSLDDVDRAATLIAETCRLVTAHTDFTAR